MGSYMFKSQTPDSVTKFMLVPVDGVFLEKELLQDGDGNKFVLEQTIEVKGIVFDKKPNLKKNRLIDGFKFDSREYKNGYSLHKRQKVVFENGFPLGSKRKVNKILKTGNVYSFQHEAYGWKLIEKYRVIPGEFLVQKVHVTKLEFYTGEISGGCTILTKKEYEQYRRKGIPQSIYDDMTTENDFSGPILSDHSSLTINGNEYPDFYSHLEKIYSESKKLVSEQLEQRKRSNKDIQKSKEAGTQIQSASRSYLFIHSEWIKRSFYELEIYEPFDINQLRIEVSAERVHPTANVDYIFHLFYQTEENDLLEFEFKHNFGSNADSVDLYNARGKSVDFEVIDDDEETPYLNCTYASKNSCGYPCLPDFNMFSSKLGPGECLPNINIFQMKTIVNAFLFWKDQHCRKSILLMSFVVFCQYLLV